MKNIQNLKQKMVSILSLVLLSISLLSASGNEISAGSPKEDLPNQITISNRRLSLTLDYSHRASITSLIVNGQKVISSSDGIYTTVNIKGVDYSSLHLISRPALTKMTNRVILDKINYGDGKWVIQEKWTFTITGESIKWTIERTCSDPLPVNSEESPVFNFDNMDVWEGAYQGYGGLAWFYLFNEKLCTYGVHTHSSSFWNSKSGNGLQVSVDAPGKEVAMRYSRRKDDKLAYAVTVSEKEMLPKEDSGTHRRRFIRNSTDIWAPFTLTPGKLSQTITLSYFDFNEKYGRGKFVGINGTQVSAVLNTIARIGVIDSLHFGGNSWHTPYGPICLHEQYIAQMGLGIDDPTYLKGYQSCLDFYRDHAIQPDGRVYARWAYSDEDMMPGKGNQEGFYEAQWGILMDANPDLVTNIAELYDQTGDLAWVKTHQLSCEKSLDWILNRDSNGNGLVEMINDNMSQQMSSDWIDIIWASYENAFVNAKLYHALVKWSDIERQLHNDQKANYYQAFADRLKASFNKPTRLGGFWDEENNCYVHWIDKDKTVHGRNMVTPVNFMAIAYGICDDEDRRKLILDKIEKQMEQENLFFWPLCMTSYAPGEGKEWQFPFPAYENGDLFLSWGSVGVKAYAEYKPDLAIKYIKKVLTQYSKDGLAFQRYGRLKQDGLGDDILSGNSLSIVGLYASVYGINPLYNRLLLDPHITGELAGTQLRYTFRNKHLIITLDSNNYSISDHKFRLISDKKFGFFSTKDQLSYFESNLPVAALQVTSELSLTLTIKNWNAGKMEWVQKTQGTSGKPLAYFIHRLAPDSRYLVSVNGQSRYLARSNQQGDLVINHASKAISERITISLAK